MTVSNDVLDRVDHSIKMGAVIRDPGPMKFYGMSLIQYDEL